MGLRLHLAKAPTRTRRRVSPLDAAISLVADLILGDAGIAARLAVRSSVVSNGLLAIRLPSNNRSSSARQETGWSQRKPDLGLSGEPRRLPCRRCLSRGGSTARGTAPRSIHGRWTASAPKRLAWSSSRGNRGSHLWRVERTIPQSRRRPDRSLAEHDRGDSERAHRGTTLLFCLRVSELGTPL